jgi:hypothetical protein
MNIKCRIIALACSLVGIGCASKSQLGGHKHGISSFSPSAVIIGDWQMSESFSTRDGFSKDYVRFEHDKVTTYNICIFNDGTSSASETFASAMITDRTVTITEGSAEPIYFGNLDRSEECRVSPISPGEVEYFVIDQNTLEFAAIYPVGSKLRVSRKSNGPSFAL